MKSFDVAVVGAGPAGSTVARELALAGVRTTLIERERIPRYKSCAGGIPLRTAAVLPFSIQRVVEDTVDGIRVTHQRGRAFTRTATDPIALMVMRDRFDGLLMEEAAAAGAEFMEATALRQVEREEGRFVLRTTRGAIGTSLLVGADGVNSLTVRATGLGAGMGETCALEAEVRAPAAELSRWRGLVNVDLGYEATGYGWVFPKQSLLSVGLVLPPHLASQLRQQLGGYLDRLGLRGARIERVVGHKVRFRRGSERIAGSGALLVGDAAGLVDEFTEEGIYYAIRSGQIAARFLQRALGAGANWLGAYEHAVDRELMPELRAAGTIARLFYGCLATSPRAMLLLSAHINYFWRAFFRVQRGESSYYHELRRVHLAGPLGQLLLRSPNFRSVRA